MSVNLKEENFTGEISVVSFEDGSYSNWECAPIGNKFLVEA